MISQYLSGTTASGLYEAKLAREEFPGESPCLCACFQDEDMEELLELTDHIVFNSERQLRKYGARCREAGISVGYVSILNVQHRVTTRSMTLVHLDLVSELL